MSRPGRGRALAALLAAALAALPAAGCGRAGPEGGGGAAPAASAPATATTGAPATTRAPATTAARGSTAEDLVVALRQGGLPILGWTLVSGPTDPDHLLGRPGQYTSKVVFSDRRLVAGGGTEAANLADGGAIEVFASPTFAARRVGLLAGRARVSRHGRVVLALSVRLTPAWARRYREALDRAL